MAVQVGKLGLPSIRSGDRNIPVRGSGFEVRKEVCAAKMKAPQLRKVPVRKSRTERVSSFTLSHKAEKRNKYSSHGPSSCRPRAVLDDRVSISERIRKMFGSVVISIDAVHQVAHSIKSSLAASSGKCRLNKVMEAPLNPHAETLGLILNVFERSLANSPQLMFHAMLTVSDYISYSTYRLKLSESEDNLLNQDYSPDVPNNYDQVEMDIKEQFQDIHDLSVPSKLKPLAASKIMMADGNDGAELSPVLPDLADDNAAYSGEDGPLNKEKTFRMVFGKHRDHIPGEVSTDEEFVPMSMGLEPSVNNNTEEELQGNDVAEDNDSRAAYINQLDLYYQNKLEHDPVQPVVLSNYAQFLASVKKDYDRAEMAFLRSIRIDGSDGETLWRYSQFLWNIRSDLKGAESFLKAAVSADPSNPFLTGSYAHFLWHAQEQAGPQDAKPDVVDSTL